MNTTRKKLMVAHRYHLVDPSPWPILGAFAGLFFMVGFTTWMHSYNGGTAAFFFGIFSVIFVMFGWWKDVIREGTFEGHHTQIVQKGLKYGMILFIASEVMFFFAFFWAFFHSSLSPAIQIGGIWPPRGIPVLSPWEIPFLNTIILLLSGASLTWSHHAMIAGQKKEMVNGLIVTVLLAIFFTACQVFEYVEAPFTMSDGVYGSTFFIATGFHGMHVIIGSLFLIVCLVRMYKNHFTTTHHIGFEAAAWYWHFVDVVWLFLFVSIYWWGGQ